MSRLNDAHIVSGSPTEAQSIEHDSRRCTPDSVFVAIPGAAHDGNAFISQARAAGVRQFLVEEGLQAQWEPNLAPTDVVVAVPSSRIALAQAAAGLYGRPTAALGMVGVTGTDGKTTTTHLIAHVLTTCGRQAGYLSSVEFGDGRHAELNASHMTTVEANEVQRRLALMRDSGAAWGVVEASSIGLDMHRVDECEFDVAVFTNLTPDHLDYHGTMDAYRDAKTGLFRMLDTSVAKPDIQKRAVVNAGDPASGAMLAATSAQSCTYALGSPADFSASGITPLRFGTGFTIHYGDQAVSAESPLLGDYNVENALAAVGVAVSSGVALPDAAAALASFPGVPGRMERIDCGQSFRVIVDIASTEQAMRNVLGVLRVATAGRLIVVFGAAGERDVERRHGLARAVAELADRAIITNEDPRSERPDAILDEIASALRAADFSQFEAIEDRRAAIARAFAVAEAGDTVLLAGKGTEQSIVIGTTHHAWDERSVARELLGSPESQRV
jgi:UDP-N-acetylmuramoyl-L-alanyl-D-glutamate--2,6-diaminopimelate ligase